MCKIYMFAVETKSINDTRKGKSAYENVGRRCKNVAKKKIENRLRSN